MNTLMHGNASQDVEGALPGVSLKVGLVAALLVALVVGTQWTLFEAPPLPEAVAASYVAPQRCTSAPEFALPCQDRASVRVAALHS